MAKFRSKSLPIKRSEYRQPAPRGRLRSLILCTCSPGHGAKSSRLTSAIAPKNQPSRQRRLDIQGIRAIAVILVVLFHAEIPGFGGGYVGVDVFFVISGFLISTHLLESLRTNGRIGF